MRRVFVWIHRYVGLAMALFLIIEGVTGSLLAFRADLSALLDPSLVAARPSPDARKLELAELAERAEAQMPRATAAYFFRLRDDQAIVRMAPRNDPATGKPFPGDPGVIVLDPWTGKELGRSPYSGYTQGFVANIMPFVNDLHTSLAMGGAGAWILAILAILWTIDCFVGFYLTLPVTLEKFWTRWKPAWLVKRNAGFYRMNFDLHRAGGLWPWAMLFVFAWSSVCLVDNLGVYENLTAALFDTRPIAEQLASVAAPREGVGPMKLDWRAAQARGKELVAEQAAAGGFRLLEPKGLTSLSYARSYNYSVETDRFFPADKELVVFFDGDDGSFRAVMGTSTGHSGETLTGWLRALHMARDPMDYFPYRIFVCILGLIVAMLSMTGVYVWWKKRRARQFHAQHRGSLAVPVTREAAL
ncbi:MAG TPA: PepSY-associated TM helix domain-containing protein [Methylocystis sp.]|nr:PepSY-associated TM helix domain-containing protein [Methylocystis sp.]